MGGRSGTRSMYADRIFLVTTFSVRVREHAEKVLSVKLTVGVNWWVLGGNGDGMGTICDGDGWFVGRM